MSFYVNQSLDGQREKMVSRLSPKRLVIKRNPEYISKKEKCDDNTTSLGGAPSNHNYKSHNYGTGTTIRHGEIVFDSEMETNTDSSEKDRLAIVEIPDRKFKTRAALHHWRLARDLNDHVTMMEIK